MFGSCVYFCIWGRLGKAQVERLQIELAAAHEKTAALEEETAMLKGATSLKRAE
jgi:hypothetical protein